MSLSVPFPLAYGGSNLSRFFGWTLLIMNSPSVLQPTATPTLPIYVCHLPGSPNRAQTRRLKTPEVRANRRTNLKACLDFGGSVVTVYQSLSGILAHRGSCRPTLLMILASPDLNSASRTFSRVLAMSIVLALPSHQGLE